MSEMVEKAARAFHEAVRLAPNRASPWPPYDELTQIDKDILRLGIRAAIEAMRQPTEAMVRESYPYVGSDHTTSDDFVDAWQAAIDEALK